MKQIEEILRPHLHQIPYGNVRSHYTCWADECGSTANLAIVYEVPGGSTNQINIIYHETTATFDYLALDSSEECVTTSPEEVYRFVRDAVERIPDIRRQRLEEDICRWAAQGMTQKELFQRITMLLQIEDLKGGTVTLQEMKKGIKYILEIVRSTG